MRQARRGGGTTVSGATVTISSGDPYLGFAHGGEADFRGRHGVFYNFFSAPDFSVNVKTEESRFFLHGNKLTVDGTFITEAHVVVRNRTPAHTKWANASFIAANLNDFNTGWAFVQGSCGGANFTRGLGSPKKVCGGLTVKTTFSGASFTVGNWTLTVHGNYVYGRISGPQHRLDLAFKARGDAPERSLPHGIIGQSFSSTAPRHGKKDLYPKEGRTVTSAMAPPLMPRMR